MNFRLSHPRDQLVAIMNRIYRNGMSTLSGGNLSIKVDAEDIWITPSGVDNGTITAKGIIFSYLKNSNLSVSRGQN